MKWLRLDSDDNVVGRLGADNSPGDPGDGGRWIQVPQADYNTVKGLRKFHPMTDILRYRWDGSQLVENPDTRPSAWFSTISEDPSPPNTVVVDLNLGDPTTTVCLRIPGANITNDRIIQLRGVGLRRFSFVSGEAQITINTTEVKRFIIDACDLLQIRNRLAVRVISDEL